MSDEWTTIGINVPPGDTAAALLQLLRTSFGFGDSPTDPRGLERAADGACAWWGPPIDDAVARDALYLVQYALDLRRFGEHAPGLANWTWERFDLMADDLLRGLRERRAGGDDGAERPR